MRAQPVGRVPAGSEPPVRRRFLATLGAALGGLVVLGRARRADAATLSTEPYLGEIMLFAGTYAPRGWALCNGQLLPINQNQALFSLLGTQYGGNGQTTFALPDLRGRAPIHFGQGPGLSAYAQGQAGGTEAHTLVTAEMPAHSHVAYGDSTDGSTESPVNALPARNAAAIPSFGTNASAALAGGHIAPAGGSQPHDNMAPYLVVNYCIAVQGIFPPQA